MNTFEREPSPSRNGLLAGLVLLIALLALIMPYLVGRAITPIRDGKVEALSFGRLDQLRYIGQVKAWSKRLVDVDYTLRTITSRPLADAVDQLVRADNDVVALMDEIARMDTPGTYSSINRDGYNTATIYLSAVRAFSAAATAPAPERLTEAARQLDAARTAYSAWTGNPFLQ